MSRTYNPVKAIRRVIRYECTAASTVTINGTALVLSGGVMGTVVNTTARALYTACRVRRARVWMTPPTNTTASGTVAQAASLSFSWGPTVGNQFYGASDSHVFATSNSPSMPLYIESVPPKGSNAEGWIMSGNTDQIFEMHTTGPTGTFAAIPAGTILELDIDFIPNSGEALGASLALTTVALGFIYFPVLDNQNFKVWYPIGLSSTV